MMYKTVIKQAFVLFAVLQLSTSVRHKLPHFTYEDVALHLEWDDSQRFCGEYAGAILHGVCQHYKTVIGKEPAEMCCKNPCTVRKLKAIYCQTNFDPRPNFDVKYRILYPTTTTTEKTTPEPGYAKILRTAYDMLQPKPKSPTMSLFKI